jgi:hypothetical protein
MYPRLGGCPNPLGTVTKLPSNYLVEFDLPRCFLLSNKLKLTLLIVGLCMVVHAFVPCESAGYINILSRLISRSSFCKPNMFLLISGLHSNAPFLS